MAKALVTAEWSGFESVLAGLSGARIGDAKKAVKQKATEIAAAGRDELRASINDNTGNLRRAQKSKSTRSGGAVIYSDRSGGNSGKGYHIHIVDKGSKKRVTKRGADRGTMPAANIVDPVSTRARARVNAELVPHVIDAIRNGYKKAIRK